MRCAGSILRGYLMSEPTTMRAGAYRRVLANGLTIAAATPEHAEQLEHLQTVVFPTLADEERFKARHYRKHLELFPEGQFVGLDGQRVVAATATIRLHFDFDHVTHTFGDIIQGGWLTSHEPAGDWLYGADIGVHPDYRSQGLSSLLYKARQALVVRLGLRGHFAGAMPKGYGAVRLEMPIEAYLHEVVRNERFDPVLSIQLKRGYRMYGVIPEYLEDPSCANYGVLIVWRNPEVTW
jgi:GNAT superfamily N-acetyltransferase